MGGSLKEYLRIHLDSEGSVPPSALKAGEHVPKKSLSQPQVGQLPCPQEQPDTSLYETRMRWRLRWFFAILIGAVYIILTLSAIIGFFVIRDPRLLALVPAPNVLLLAAVYLVPMHKGETQAKGIQDAQKAKSDH